MDDMQQKMRLCEEAIQQLALALRVIQEELKVTSHEANHEYLRQRYRKLVIEIADLTLAADVLMR